MFTNDPNNQFVILPVPFMGNVSYGKGANRGPDAILEACHQLEYYDLYSQTRPVDAGITLIDEVDTRDEDAVVDRVAKHFREDQRFTVLLGGDHSSSIGAVKALVERYDNLSVLQLDAHPDLFYSWNGSSNNHRCFGRHASNAQALIQVGIRACDEDERSLAQQSSNIKQYYAHQPVDVQDVIAQLTENVYISIDVDAFDPSIVRNTGTPEPGGYDWNFVINLLLQVFATRNVVGCDIVEFAPSGDADNYRAESYMLAKLMYVLFGLKQKQLTGGGNEY